jgi:hypothetical protein
MADSLQNAARLLAASLERVARGLSGADQAVISFVENLGWTLPSVPPAIKTLASLAQVISETYTTLNASLSGQSASGTPSPDLVAQYLDLVSKVPGLISQLGSLPSSLQAQLPANFLASTNFANQFPRRMLDLCLYELMVAKTKRMESILRLAGLVEVVQEPANAAVFQPAYLRRTIRWDRFGKFLGDPATLLSDAYAWGGATFDGASLLEEFMHLSFALAGPAEIDWPTPERIQAIIGALPAYDAVGTWQLTIPLIDQDVVQADISILPLAASGGAPPGIALGLLLSASVPPQIQLSDLLSLQLDGPDGLNAGVSLVLRPGRAPQVRLGLEGPTGSNVSATRTGATLTIGRTDPMSLLSLPLGLDLQVVAVTVGGGIDAGSGSPEPFIAAGLTGGKLMLDLSGSDSFVSEIIPGGPLELDFNLGISWTPSGLAFTGSGALTLSVPLHQQLGPFEIDSLTIVGTLSGNSLQLETSATGGADLGPLQATVDRIGLQSTLSFTAGNLGPMNLAFGFKPPNGIGLSVDAGVVQGGGYLYIDTAHGEYAGAMQLEIADFLSVSAIGLISTKMPDGSSGFSLLIIITADFGAGIQLGFGFTLLAVGGLLGLNRSLLFQPLMDGIRTDSIESIMFPQNVVANATRIIADLRAIFPPQEGTFLIGPMAKLGWGEPTLISLSLGVIIEIPPGDIAILGVLKLALPADDIAVLVLQVNFAGALEFDKQRLYFFASLYDSHVLFITLEGEMGVLMAYGDDANFVVSIGGFNPQFNPPPLPFPTPKRIEVDIINESYARIRCDGYFAVTTNTVQFGSQSEFFFGFSALNLSGSSGFDALIQFSPFHFSVSISTSFNVNVFGLGVYGIDMALTLEGPTPWHAHGTASISFLFFSIGIGVDFTWGDSQNTMLPPVAVMPILDGEYGKQSNWKSVLPSGSNLLVALRQMDPAETAMVLHPVGTLQVSQRAVPIDLLLDKDGNQQPSDANYFTLDVTSGGLNKIRTLTEQFAPAQFKNMDDATKLSQPAYVPMDSGIELAAAGNAYASGTAITRNVRYDLTVIDTKLRRVFRKFYVYTGSLFVHFLAGSSVTRSVLSARRQGQMQPYADHVAVNPETFAVALQSNNKAYSVEATSFLSQAAAQDYLSRAVANDATLSGTLHVLPQFEVAA